MKSSFCESENQRGSELLQVSEVSHKSWSLTIRPIIKRLRLSVDLEKAYFVLNELSEIVDTEPKNKLEALYFANNQHRIYSYTDIAYDYVSRIRSGLDDLIAKTRRSTLEKGGENDKEEN